MKKLVAGLTSMLVIGALFAIAIINDLRSDLRNERARGEAFSQQLQVLRAQVENSSAGSGGMAANGESEKVPSIQAQVLSARADAPNRNLGSALTSVSEQELMRDPDYLSGMRAQIRASLLERHAGLSQILKITAAQVSQVVDILADEQMSIRGTSPTAASDTSPGSSAIQEMIRQQQAIKMNTELELQRILGGEKLQEWKEYQDGLPSRQRVSQLQSGLQLAGEPLQNEQLEALVKLLAIEQKRSLDAVRSFQDKLRSGQIDQKGHAEFRSGQVSATLVGNQRVLSAAEEFLSPSQMGALREMLEQQSALARAQERAFSQAVVQ